MHESISAFLEAKAKKAAAKELSMTATGEAKLAERENRSADAEAAWSRVAEHGFRGGSEGAAFAEMQRIADEYVQAHDGDLALLKGYLKPDATPAEQHEAQEKLIGMVEFLRENGQPEASAIAEMFELAYFPRPAIGTRAAITYRKPGMGG